MTTIWTGVAVVAALVLGLVVFVFMSTKAKYEGILTDEHYLEVARLIAEEEAPAVQRVNQQLSIPGAELQKREVSDPRVRMSDKGVVAIYTVNLIEDQYFHRNSFSHHGGPLAFAAGGRFAYFALTALGVDPNSVYIVHTGVTHVGFVRKREDHDAYVKREPRIPGVTELHDLNERATAWVHSSEAISERRRTDCAHGGDRNPAIQPTRFAGG